MYLIDEQVNKSNTKCKLRCNKLQFLNELRVKVYIFKCGAPPNGANCLGELNENDSSTYILQGDRFEFMLSISP